MFFTVSSELGNLEAKLYSAPRGWNSVDSDPPKLDPEFSNTRGCQRVRSGSSLTVDAVAEHDRVLVHLLTSRLNSCKLAFPVVSVDLAAAYQSLYSASVDSDNVRQDRTLVLTLRHANAGGNIVRSPVVRNARESESLPLQCFGEAFHRVARRGKC